MYKSILFLLILVNLQIASATTYHCSHIEICRMGQIILHENSIKDIVLENIIVQSGDPHEFEPSIQDIKKLLNAPTLLVGPIELNPWMKKISYLRTKDKKLKTITLTLPDFAKREYPAKESEPLGHFWLYPKIYCQLKKQLAEELKYKFSLCNSATIEYQLRQDLKNIAIPIILTHDALLPLLKKLAAHKNQIVAMKGSSHHEEVSAAAIKKVYDALSAPKVLWILENNIATAENIKNKIRTTDIVIKIDTAKSAFDSASNEDFSILQSLHKKLQEIRP
jgi:ABC-type Zn uptake system ZnuABC Zn-binding protein ZnuA